MASPTPRDRRRLDLTKALHRASLGDHSPTPDEALRAKQERFKANSHVRYCEHAEYFPCRICDKTDATESLFCTINHMQTSLSQALYALATAVQLLDEAEYPGTCSENGDCHNCAWDSGRDWCKDQLAKLRLAK